MKSKYIQPTSKTLHLGPIQVIAFSDGGQSNPGMGSGGGDSSGGGFSDGDMENPNISGSSGGFWDNDQMW